LFWKQIPSNPTTGYIYKNWNQARNWWLIPAILATQEAEIRRIMVWSQLEQIVPWDPTSKKKKTLQKKGWWSGSRCSPEFKPQYRKTKNKQKKK
jgi:hypothetical protein